MKFYETPNIELWELLSKDVIAASEEIPPEETEEETDDKYIVDGGEL